MVSKQTLALTIGALTGCAGGGTKSEPAPVTADAAKASAPAAPAGVDENLARLRGLAVFEVGVLMVDAPDGAYACYGPCPQFKDEIAAAEAHAAGRLGRLVEVAAKATADASAESCAAATIERNLAALRALKIVDVQGLVRDLPEGGSCYAGQCPEDTPEGKARMCERAGKLAGIAAAAKDL